MLPSTTGSIVVLPVVQVLQCEKSFGPASGIIATMMFFNCTVQYSTDDRVEHTIKWGMEHNSTPVHPTSYKVLYK